MIVKPGQRWTFVHSDGTETEYVVVNPDEEMSEPERRRLWAKWEDEIDGPHMLVYLLNERTGKYAMVTYYWLRRPARPGVSHWLAPQVVEQAA